MICSVSYISLCAYSGDLLFDMFVGLERLSTGMIYNSRSDCMLVEGSSMALSHVMT